VVPLDSRDHGCGDHRGTDTGHFDIDLNSIPGNRLELGIGEEPDRLALDLLDLASRIALWENTGAKRHPRGQYEAQI
jgi:hypothetical protein